MADDNKAKPDTEAAEKPFSDPRRNLLTVIVVGGLMLVEGAGIFTAIKLMGGDPQSSMAADGPMGGILGPDGNLLPPNIELKVTDVVAFNSKTGRVFVYQLTVYAELETKHAEQVENLLEHRQNAVDDRFSRIVRACDPKYMEEPGLETLRRQFRAALADILGQDAVIKEILIPQFSKQRAD